MVGSTRLTVCGTMTYCMDCAYVMPSEDAASNWPLEIDWIPARKISAR